MIRYNIAKKILRERYGGALAFCIHAHVLTHTPSYHDFYEAAIRTAGGIYLCQFVIDWSPLRTSWRKGKIYTTDEIPCPPGEFLEPLGLGPAFAAALPLSSSWWPYSGQLMMGVEIGDTKKLWTWRYMERWPAKRQAIPLFAAAFGVKVEEEIQSYEANHRT